MNNLRSFILIPVLVIQISLILANNGRELFRLPEFTASFFRDIRYESSSGNDQPANGFRWIEQGDAGYGKSCICLNEKPLSSAVQAEIIAKKSGNPPVRMALQKRPLRKVSGINHICFVGSGNAELF